MTTTVQGRRLILGTSITGGIVRLAPTDHTVAITAGFASAADMLAEQIAAGAAIDGCSVTVINARGGDLDDCAELLTAAADVAVGRGEAVTRGDGVFRPLVIVVYGWDRLMQGAPGMAGEMQAILRLASRTNIRLIATAGDRQASSWGRMFTTVIHGTGRTFRMLRGSTSEAFQTAAV